MQSLMRNDKMQVEYKIFAMHCLFKQNLKTFMTNFDFVKKLMTNFDFLIFDIIDVPNKIFFIRI
ncbi:hypothetical protein BpHYR1_009523 [Brachionus plicatilis]|uniref:Uncharacterized protein n=1 Tax=Brachionus plicatilis TaxID=10195 RepID=A0A3M7SU09_BRAPC|nr:hypothetical protein BpHYR1_009523 [Brachionus plicatilis]